MDRYDTGLTRYVAPTNTKLCRVNIQNMRVSGGPGAGETCFMFQHEQSNWASVSDVIRAFSNKVKKKELM